MRRGDLVGWTTFSIVFEWLAKVKSLGAVACFLRGRAKDLSAPQYNHSSVLTDTNNASHAAQHISKKRCNIHWMEKACSTYGRLEKGYTGCWSEELRKTAHLDNLGIDGKIISKWSFKMWNG